MSAADSIPKTPNPESNSPQNQAPIEQSDLKINAKVEDFSSDQSNLRSSNGGEGEDQEEEDGEEQGECGFCLYMKGGGCRDSFISWENCIEEAEKNKEDIVEKCAEITAKLKLCMEAHADYYAPILNAEKAAEQEVKNELEKEAAAERAEAAAKQSEQSADKSDSQKK